MNKRIAILLTEGFADWEFGLLAGAGRGYYSVDTVFVSPGGRPVMSMGGLSVSPSGDCYEISPKEFDALVLIGGTIWEKATAPDVSKLVDDFRQAGCVVAAICGATLALARAGLLNDVAHTSNGRDFLNAHVKAYKGAGLYKDQPAAVVGQRIVTASGTAPDTFAAEVLNAIGVDAAQVQQLKSMLASEHID
jgi:putative intracellular protease/amidase